AAKARIVSQSARRRPSLRSVLAANFWTFPPGGFQCCRRQCPASRPQKPVGSDGGPVGDPLLSPRPRPRGSRFVTCLRIEGVFVGESVSVFEFVFEFEGGKRARSAVDVESVQAGTVELLSV